ncbi:MAG: hypothetical protein OXE58_10195 [Acidobacteria bacterium]|nr:hypothetical protein [Acidobacteriota bacterium]
MAIRALRPEVSAERADACMFAAYTGFGLAAFLVALYLAMD